MKKFLRVIENENDVAKKSVFIEIFNAWHPHIFTMARGSVSLNFSMHTHISRASRFIYKHVERNMSHI
jgi:hypothetical protein